MWGRRFLNLFFVRLFNIAHTFSIGFRSGERAGQGIFLIPRVGRVVLVVVIGAHAFPCLCPATVPAPLHSPPSLYKPDVYALSKSPLSHHLSHTTRVANATRSRTAHVGVRCTAWASTRTGHAGRDPAVLVSVYGGRAHRIDPQPPSHLSVSPERKYRPPSGKGLRRRQPRRTRKAVVGRYIYLKLEDSAICF